MLGGKTMIQRVYEQVSKVPGIDVVIATDDERIANVARAFGANVVMTSAQLQSGTDRCIEAYVTLSKDYDILINVQGDEPLIDGPSIDKAIQPVMDKKFDLTSLRVPVKSVEDLQNKNVVKVIVDDFNRALYFSRYPIPYSRVEPAQAVSPFLCSQHVGIYVYRKEALLKMSSLPATDLERAESLEQLRAMKAGIAIGVFEANFDSVGVDTQEDLEKVRRILNRG